MLFYKSEQGYVPGLDLASIERKKKEIQKARRVSESGLILSIMQNDRADLHAAIWSRKLQVTHQLLCHGLAFPPVIRLRLHSLPRTTTHKATKSRITHHSFRNPLHQSG